MDNRSNDNEIEKTKRKLLADYKTHLDEIFAAETFDLDFEQREQLIYGKLKKETNKLIEDHVEKDPRGVSHKPEETCLCSCGTEAILCKDKNGEPKIFGREIKTKSGPVTVKENGYYCSKHRKIFFPSQEDS